LHDGRCYGGAVRLAVLLLVLLVLLAGAGVRAEDEEGEEPTGLSTRLQGIDDATEYHADHPEAVGEEPDPGAAEADDPDAEPTVAEPGADPPEPPARARRTAREQASPPAAGRGGAAESPIGTSPLERPPPADDEP
jgi:hypothetical protein